jgi:uncharacterized protein GlcG (DUF336 family)
MFVKASLVLTDAALLAMLQAAVTKADEIGQPQCIVIVDASGVALAELRMNGAKYLSLKSARTKACTAASIRGASHDIPETVGLSIAAATGGAVTGLSGGLPITVKGQCVGGIGIGSGSPDQDLEVAQAALSAIDADH